MTGPNILTSLPRTERLVQRNGLRARKIARKIDAAIMKVLEMVAARIVCRHRPNGIYLAGGGALLKGLDRRLSEKTNIPFHIAEDPLRAIARGTGIALKNINRFSFLMRFPL